jgi:hypothetical protein
VDFLPLPPKHKALKVLYLTDNLVERAFLALTHGADWAELPQDLKELQPEMWASLGALLLSTYKVKAMSTVH